jgi:hypothetical protein
LADEALEWFGAGGELGLSGGGEEEPRTGLKRVFPAAGADVAAALGDDEQAAVAGGGPGVSCSDEEVADLEAAGAGVGEAAGFDVGGGFGQDFGRYAAAGGYLGYAEFLIIENIEAEIEVAAHVAGLGRHDDALAFELAAHNPVGRLHHFEQQQAGAERVNQTTWDPPDLTDLNGDGLEASIHPGDVLSRDDLAPLGSGGGVLKAEAEVAGVAGADTEDHIALQFAVG